MYLYPYGNFWMQHACRGHLYLCSVAGVTGTLCSSWKTFCLVTSTNSQIKAEAKNKRQSRLFLYRDYTTYMILKKHFVPQIFIFYYHPYHHHHEYDSTAGNSELELCWDMNL